MVLNHREDSIMRSPGLPIIRKCMPLLSFIMLLTVSYAGAQVVEPPHLVIEKVLNTGGTICPGFTIDVSVTLTGSGTAGFVREPIDVVCLIDRSGSMTFGGRCGWNEYLDPPYGPLGAPYTQTRYHPFVDAIWAAWKFYDYLVDVPPSIGYVDYGGLFFYSTTVPETESVTTPTPVQLDTYGVDTPVPPTPNQSKQFWWHNQLADSGVGGSTAIGPALQLGKQFLAGMPTHPAPPTVSPGTPTPDVTYPAVQGRRYMVLLTDGRPNVAWSPTPTPFGNTTPPPGPSWGTSAYQHAIEMARRSTLVAPFGGYNDFNSITIYTVGIGSGVESNLMQQIASPWSYPFIPTQTPLPENAKYGEYKWAQTESDLIDMFQQIAAAITNDRAGKDITINENWGNGGMCPGGEEIHTSIVPGSWNIAPTIVPGPPDTYRWFFPELLVNDSITLTFQIEVESGLPDGTFTLLECPSSVEYTSYHGFPQQQDIVDPGLTIGACTTPIDTPTATRTPSATPTNTPTCIPEILLSESFESGTMTQWEGYGPSTQVRLLDDETEAYEGDYCLYFAGSDSVGGPNEAYASLVLSLHDPIRFGTVLSFRIKLDNFETIEKSGRDGRAGDDRFVVAVSGDHLLMEEFGPAEEDEFGSHVWFYWSMDLSSFAGQDITIMFRSDFPTTYPNPDPQSNAAMVMIDSIQIADFCYEGTPTPTASPTPPEAIPTTSQAGLVTLLALVSLLLIFPFIRK